MGFQGGLIEQLAKFMIIRNNKTHKIVELTYQEWSSYLSNRQHYEYTIINQDIVLLRYINPSGERVCLKCVERAEAYQILRLNPKDFDFTEIEGGYLVNAQVLPFAKPPFKIIHRASIILKMKSRVRDLVVRLVFVTRTLTRYFIDVFG